MTLAEGITIGLAFAGLLGTFFGYAIHASNRTGHLEERVQTGADRAAEERAHTSLKFSELYTRTSEHDATLAALTTNVNNIALTTQKMDGKLDRLIEKSYGKEDEEK